nr:hypothetical protein [Tanacetum cinerariifolium]
MDAYAALTRRVKHLEYDKVAQALEITKLKMRVKKLKKRNKVRVLKLRRLQRVGTSQRVATSNDTVMDDESNQGRMIAKIDQDDAVVLKDDKEEDKEVSDAVKDVEDDNVNESAQDQERQAKSQDEIYKIDMDHANKILSIETITATNTIVTAAEAQVFAATLTAAPARITAAPSRRRKGVVIRDREETKVDESAQDQGRQAESQAKIYKIDMDHANKVLSMQDDKTEPAEVQEVVDVVTTTKLITKVVTAASAIVTTAEAQVPAVTPTAAPARIVTAPSRRRKRVVIRDPESESTTSTIIPAETKSKDKCKGILVDEPKPLKKKQQIELDKQYARELHVKLNKDIDWDEAIDHVKRKAKEDPAVKRYQVLKRKPQTEAQARKTMIMYLKNVAGFKMVYFKEMSYDDIRLIFEAKFNSNVAFLLKTKERIKKDENRALQKLNETLAERAAKRRKLDDEIWKTQRNEHGPAKVKGWKLLESCSMQIITFTSTQLILLVKRKYLLTRFTLDQMLNAVRLEVEDESEVSLELLRFIRQQHQEG